jgi:hypothetical protein
MAMPHLRCRPFKAAAGNFRISLPTPFGKLWRPPAARTMPPVPLSWVDFHPLGATVLPGHDLCARSFRQGDSTWPERALVIKEDYHS